MSGELAAGQYDQRIRIQKRTKTTRDSGSIGSSDWQDVIDQDLPAHYKPVSGGERIRGVTIVSTATALFVVRHMAQLVQTPGEVTEYRIKWLSSHADPAKAAIFHVVRAHDPRGRRREFWLEAKEESR